MSVYWQEQIWESDALSGMDKLVVLAMARAAGEDGVAFLSVKSIGEVTGVGVTKIGLALKAAEDRGVISRVSAEDRGGLGDFRSVVYRFQAPEVSPPAGDATPRGGYIWKRDPMIPDVGREDDHLRVAESRLRVAESRLRVAGTTSSNENGVGSAHASTGKEAKSNSTVTARLMEQFARELKAAIRDQDAVALGPFKRQALAGTFGLLQRRDGLTEEQISRMISAYLCMPSAWNPTIHPWQDFASGGTLTRLRNQTKHLDAPEYFAPAPALTEVMAGLTVDEMVLELRRQDEERGPKWAR